MTSEVNGYVVVVSLRADVQPYRGVDRDPWAPLVASDGQWRLPPELDRELMLARSGEARGDFSFPTVTDLSIARRLLAAARPEKDPELIAIYSPYLTEGLGRAPWPQEEADFLGVDVVGLGEWSLLGALQSDGAPPSVRLPSGLLNSNGLLPDATRLPDVVRHYRAAARAGHVEELAGPGQLPIEPVSVFSVR